MKTCKICGGETRKNRDVCIGCHCVKQVAKSKEHTPKRVLDKASKHLEAKPELFCISWKSFFKKNTKTVV